MSSAARSPARGAAIAGRFAAPGADCHAIAGSVLRRPERMGQLFECLHSGKAEVRYGSAKVLRLISERSPGLLYPHFDLFFRLFEGENTIHRWGATQILGNLAAVDEAGKFEAVLDRFLRPILGREMIGAANVIAAAAKVAAAKPALAGRIASAILGVEGARYKTPECRNVAIGHAIRAFDRIYPLVPDRKPVFEFVTRQLENTRPATRRKAEQFRRRWGLKPAPRGR